jgi:hypothetical protein
MALTKRRILAWLDPFSSIFSMYSVLGDALYIISRRGRWKIYRAQIYDLYLYYPSVHGTEKLLKALNFIKRALSWIQGRSIARQPARKVPIIPCHSL